MIVKPALRKVVQLVLSAERKLCASAKVAGPGCEKAGGIGNAQEGFEQLEPCCSEQKKRGEWRRQEGEAAQRLKANFRLRRCRGQSDSRGMVTSLQPALDTRAEINVHRMTLFSLCTMIFPFSPFLHPPPFSNLNLLVHHALKVLDTSRNIRLKRQARNDRLNIYSHERGNQRKGARVSDRRAASKAQTRHVQISALGLISLAFSRDPTLTNTFPGMESGVE